MNTEPINPQRSKFNSVMKELKQFNIYNKEGNIINFQKCFILETNKN